MRAAVVPSLGAPLEIQDLPVPDPGPGQVLVRIEASGLCHTDIHAARGDWPVKPTPPFVPGHEGVGGRRALGAGRDRAGRSATGSRCLAGHACGSLPLLRRPAGRRCARAQQNTGYSIDGGFAEYAVADARFAVPVPDGIDPLDAAPLTCAGVTTYKAIKVVRCRADRPGQHLGIGGLGHLAVQYAAIVGATVVGVDVRRSKLELAKRARRDHVGRRRDEDPVAAIQALGGADVAVALAVIPDVDSSRRYASLRRGGRLVSSALPKADELTVPIFDTVLKGISVIGSIVGTRQDLAEVFELHAAGRTRVIAETRKLEQVNEAFDEVLAGDIPARLVFRF